jgi:hypothetical protein
MRPSKWGNPFSTGRRGDDVRRYREWLPRQPELIAALGEVCGKRLGCVCKTPAAARARGEAWDRACHGDVIAELADAMTEERQR